MQRTRDPPGVRPTPGSMRHSGVITRRGSCTSAVMVHYGQSVAYGDPYQNDQIFTRGGFWWILDLIHWTPDACNVFLFLFTRGWILMDPDVGEEDPVQWFTGISRQLVASYDMPGVQWTHSLPGTLLSSDLFSPQTRTG